MIVRRVAACALVLAVASCGDTSIAPVALTLDVAGRAPASFDVDGFTVDLSEASIAFGPLYACAAEVASLDLCETAVVESRASVTVDGLDPSPQALPLVGTTGIVRSVMYDHGLTWRLTDARPVATDGAVSGHSMRFSGHAVRGVEVLDFTAEVDIRPGAPGAPGVFGVPAEGEITDATERLRITFDPIAWWSTVDFEALAVRAAGNGGSIALASDDPALDPLIHAATVTLLPGVVWDAPP